MDRIKVGSRVKFIGPEYDRYGGGPTIGHRGIVTHREGCMVTPVGEPPIELVVVECDGNIHPFVMGIHRLEVV